MIVIYIITYQIPLLQDGNTTSIPAMDMDENVNKINEATIRTLKRSGTSKPSSSELVTKGIGYRL